MSVVCLDSIRATYVGKWELSFTLVRFQERLTQQIWNMVTSAWFWVLPWIARRCTNHPLGQARCTAHTTLLDRHCRLVGTLRCVCTFPGCHAPLQQQRGPLVHWLRCISFCPCSQPLYRWQISCLSAAVACCLLSIARCRAHLVFQKSGVVGCPFDLHECAALRSLAVCSGHHS